MPRRKSAKNTALLPWLSAKGDCREGRFIMVGNSLLLSRKDASKREQNAFLTVTPGTRVLYLALCMEAGGKNTVRFSHSAAQKYGISPTTYDRGIKQLCKAGLIEQVLDDQRSQFATNVFRFTSEWKSNPAPHFGVGQK